MSEGVPEGASLPDGIEVDDAAAYFGVVDSSDVLQQMMSMDSKQALSKALEHLADIILRPGEFDFEAASERLQCEGGEIYFLIFGHLNLMALPDPLLQFAGQSDSTGAANTAHPLATGDVVQALTPLFDPMQFLKILAIAYATGGTTEVERYMQSIESIMAAPSDNVEKMQTMAEEFKSSLDVAGHALPMPLFASDQAQPAEIEMGTIIERREPEPAPAPAEPNLKSSQNQNQHLRLRLRNLKLNRYLCQQSPFLFQPSIRSHYQVKRSQLKKLDSRTKLRLTMQRKMPLQAHLAPNLYLNPRLFQNLLKKSFQILLNQLLVEPEPVVEEQPEEEWVSDAERFIAADVDDSGSLSVEELAVAANVSIEEAEELHTAADTDGDGEVSLSEFVSSEAAQKMSSLPRPVAPVRRPIQSQQPAQQQAPQQPVRQQPTSPGVAAPQMGWQQPLPQQQPMRQPMQQPMQQPMMPQQPTMNIQPTIRSGIHCRGCGIGLDPNWRFCPICGNMNMSAHR